jgi:acyl-CoA synthetase (NDP forming)/GNAT superfamily N-acetyltransferase
VTTGRRRFPPELLFRPESVAVIGAQTPAGQRICANIAAGAFAGPVWHDVLPAAPDLAILACQAPEVEAALLALAAAGGRAAVVTSQVDELGAIARRAGVRVLGASAFGVSVPGIGLNATLSHMKIPAGRVALVTQSTSLARAVIDWAGPNGVGFSHVVGLGGNVDWGFGPTLDYLSRDPGTGLILLDVRRIRGPAAFISAARAASRLRPVVAVRPGGRLLDPSGRADAVFAQALHRAGVFVADGMEALFAAAEIFSRTRPLRHETLAVVTNAIGPGRLACDAALRAGIALAALPPEVQASLSGTLPAELVHGLVYVGRLPVHVAEAAAMLSAVPGVGGVLLLLTPTGPADAAAIEAVVAAVHTAKMPVLSCIMGETTGAGFRTRLANAGMPAFATPEQAVTAFAHLLRDRRARQAARELPGARVLDVAPQPAALARVMGPHPSATSQAPSAADVFSLLQAYGIATAAAAGRDASITVHDDAMFGPAIGLAIGAAPPAYDLPPLNLVLAQDLSRRAGAGAQEVDGVASALVRVSQLLLDAPQIATLRIALALGPGGAGARDASMTLRASGEQRALSIAPYPDALVTPFTAAGGEAFTIRPIRPEDAQAHAAMIARVPPEDLRFRFFAAVREISPEQMARLTQIDYGREMAFVAVRNASGTTAGVARAVRESLDDSAEFAILVEPAAKGRGLATHLMDRLIAWARSQRIGRITGQVLADNHTMLAFVRHLGFVTTPVPGEPDLVEAVLNLSTGQSSPE